MIDKNLLKKEAINVSVMLITLTIIFKMIFWKETAITTIRTTASIFWLFVIPGFLIMYNWHNKMDFTERLIAGTALGLAATGAIGYNLSILGIHMKYHSVIIPVSMLAIGILIVLKKR